MRDALHVSAMLVLTWFGTIVRAETASKMLVHAALWPGTEEAGDILIAAPSRDIAEPVEVAGMPGVSMVPGPMAGTVHFRRDGRVLRAEKGRPALVFIDAETLSGPETFLLLEPAEAQCLRSILSQAWILEPHGARLRPSALRLIEGFALQLGDMRLDLAATRPLPAGDGRIELRPAEQDGARIALRRAEGAEAAPLVLRAGRRFRKVADAASAEAFRVTRDRRLPLIGHAEYVAPPLTVCDTDSDWLFMRHDGADELVLGRQNLTSHVHREHGKLVLLTTGAEGLVFDAQGATRASFRADDVGVDCPAWMQRNGDAIYIDRAAVDAAPSLHGSHIVVGHSALQDTGRGRIETLLALDVLGRYAPASAKLLLPASLHGAQAEAAAAMPDLLELLGFAALPAVMVHHPLCRVEEAIWLEGGSVAQLPARVLREFRARLPARKRGRGRRFVVCQSGSGAYANETAMRDFAERRDLEMVMLDQVSPVEQIRLFADAELVVAPHGPALANLLFAPPGAKVLEISPDSAFRPYYWRLAGKLGLAYAVLPCPTADGSLDGTLTVRFDRLGNLFRMLNARM